MDEYDSEARWYYPAIMRTTTPDPLAEKYYSISPYAWCGNNPVNAIDPFGMDVWSTSDPNEIARALQALKNGKDIIYNASTWSYKSDEDFLKSGEDEAFSKGLNLRKGELYFLDNTTVNGETVSNLTHLGSAKLNFDYSNYGPDGSYNLYTKHEEDEWFKNSMMFAGGELLGAGIGALRGLSWLSRVGRTEEAINPRAVGAASKGFSKVLQTGGHTLNKSTLKALRITKEQGKIAIEALKRDLRLPADFHGKIMGNGDLVNPHTFEVLGNIFDYIP